MASRLPDVRNSLDLDFGTKFQGERIPLGDAAFQSMHARYTQLARDCEASGDITRAAFIYDGTALF